VKQFLASKSINVIEDPPYSPDLAPAEFFLFPKMKLALKGERFSDICDIQHSVTEQLKGISLQDFQRNLEVQYKRLQHCMELEGDYIESL
jgi:transposase